MCGGKVGKGALENLMQTKLEGTLKKNLSTRNRQACIKILMDVSEVREACSDSRYGDTARAIDNAGRRPPAVTHIKLQRFRTARKLETRLEAVSAKEALFLKKKNEIVDDFVAQEGKNATQAARKKNCDVYESNAVPLRVVQNRFKRFQVSNFDVKDESRSGRPTTDRVDAILEKAQRDRHIHSYDIVEELGLPMK
ncbi:hypothetical protein EVAR_48648_1 [Eumeta japonica]|uniref:Mos1 transposase HTH domain-containing protein n=1 Tax=Eumeta variegata TaxID=151549 RepID=A0A4C1XMY3_EUMVA|nr:hypothetical protein EVAR_48648_1 [Eumeta japonica]